MENQRVLIAITLSVAILLIYQYFFLPTPQQPPQPRQAAEAPSSQKLPASPPPVLGSAAPDAAASWGAKLPEGREVQVDTPLFTAVVSEAGGTLKSFRLKQYRESLAPDSGPMELVRTANNEGFPLFFSWGVEPARARVEKFAADRDRVEVDAGEQALTLTSRTGDGLKVTKTLIFRADDYRITLLVDVENPSASPVTGAPYITLFNRPFTDKDSRYLFAGPALLIDDKLHEIKPKDLAKKPAGMSFTGSLLWAGYEDSYFLTSVAPESAAQATAHFSLRQEDLVTTVVAGPTDTIEPGSRQRYSYTVFFGPKKLSLLKEYDRGLDRAVNFGWFDLIARPTLYLLNFLYGFVGNYGIAIILVTVLIKLAFWPISHKGMQSMKTMQKLQPKLAKIRERFKDDRERQQQEMMKLYQTYKVNPLGGCLPMLLQIPVFFALYKVLLQSIELRHAPFMLWINDLSAPDRLPIGVEIPWLGGIPVLTLLMGGSMYLQQQMTPSTGDPTQAKIMKFLPLIFTFLFINFASGLVLYWLVNNLLTILQQYMINRKSE